MVVLLGSPYVNDWNHVISLLFRVFWGLENVKALQASALKRVQTMPEIQSEAWWLARWLKTLETHTHIFGADVFPRVYPIVIKIILRVSETDWSNIFQGKIFRGSTTLGWEK